MAVSIGDSSALMHMSLLAGYHLTTVSTVDYGLWLWTVWVWVLCYSRRSAGQSLLEWSTHLGLTTRSLLLSDSCGFVALGRPLSREDGSLVYICCWPSPAQSFSGPSPVGLMAIFYCLRFETSLFVASYDLQGHSGSIWPRLHTGERLGDSEQAQCSTYIALAWTAEKTLFPTVSSILCVSIATDTCLLSHYLAADGFSC
jgi:hypothetical protein